MKHVIRIRMDLFLSLISLALVSRLVPSYAYGQVAALQPLPTPTQTQTQMVYTQCIDFNTDKVCEYIVLANGTTIANPLVQQLQAPAPMSQLVERQKTIIKEVQRDNDNDDNDRDDDNRDDIKYCDGQAAPAYPDSCYDRNDKDEDDDNSHRDDPDCWYGNLYVCDGNGKCDSDKFDCITDCADGSSVTTGFECPDEGDNSDRPASDSDCEDTGGSDPCGEEADQNCGGEACTDDEKEDSWVDEPAAEEEEGTWEDDGYIDENEDGDYDEGEG
jgi:hypothetical protein